MAEGAADEGVGVELDIDMAEGGRPGGQRRQRQEGLHAAADGGSGRRHRQAHAARAGEGGGELGVARAGLGEQDGHADRRSAGFAEPVEQAAVHVAVPRPAAEGGEAGLVDGDDDRRRLGRGGRGHQGLEAVIQQQVEALQRARVGEHRQRGRDDCEKPARARLQPPADGGPRAHSTKRSAGSTSSMVFQ